MKVLDLQCQHGHSFEGWFGNEDDFQSQLSRGLVQCPFCDDANITKKLSAPRLNLSAQKRNAENAINSIATDADSTPANDQKDTKLTPTTSPSDHPLRALIQSPEFQAAYLEMAKEVLAKTEDVGKDFAREARKIHYGESKERGIRGSATSDEALELLQEGIDIMPLPLPSALKSTLH